MPTYILFVQALQNIAHIELWDLNRVKAGWDGWVIPLGLLRLLYYYYQVGCDNI